MNQLLSLKHASYVWKRVVHDNPQPLLLIGLVSVTFGLFKSGVSSGKVG
ncbi:hypothetical protein GGQ71_000473 [Rhizobium taibaishanense]|uniref:Uncharacterized protein n=1 Tax=Allorhizobium taibaishanense TaxID=887144 RepID=A0A7W6HJW9_9HYPH|nr:hypothetical protein [Allorhizobium taibaishanense]